MAKITMTKYGLLALLAVAAMASSTLRAQTPSPSAPTLVIETRANLLSVFAVPSERAPQNVSGFNGWGRDYLGEVGIAEGKFWILMPSKNCLYDVKITNMNLVNRVWRRVDACRLSLITVE